MRYTLTTLQKLETQSYRKALLLLSGPTLYVIFIINDKLIKNGIGYPFLPNAMGAVHGLQVAGGIPIMVHKDDRISPCV
jgi:hypothetical protein